MYNHSMFTRIQTRAFRCLKSVDQPLGPFCALVGPNASGKTTFLDVIGFLSDLVRNRGDVLPTVQERSSTFQNLLWMKQGNAFELAVEAEIPGSIRSRVSADKQDFTHVRYELKIGLDESSNEIGLDHETLWLLTPPAASHPRQRDIFPSADEMPSLLMTSGANRRTVLKKRRGEMTTITRRARSHTTFLQAGTGPIRTIEYSR